MQRQTLNGRWDLIWPAMVLGMLVSWAANADLSGRFERERGLPVVRDVRSLAQALERYEVVFVGSREVVFAAHRGFFDNAAALLLGYGKLSTSVTTEFFESYENNAVTLAADFKRVRLESGKPLIVVGNPQTGPDALYALLRDPSLLESIDKLVLLAPAFGSPLADSADRLVPEALDFVSSNFGEDLRKFKTKPTRALFDAAVAALTPEQKRAIESRVYIVRAAAQNTAAVNPVLKPGYLFLRALGKTDGVTYVSDQKLRSLDTRDLGTVRADHWDLWASMPVSTTPALHRHAFTRALFGELLLSN